MTQENSSLELTDRHKAFLAVLEGIVGPEFVASDPATRYIYSCLLYTSPSPRD